MALSACEPTVRLTDTFDRADAPALGVATSGQSWTDRSGSWSVSGGRARPGPGYSLATVEGGVADGVASVTVVTPDSEFWLVLRAADGANYWRFGRWQSGPYQLQQISGQGIGTPNVTTLATLTPAAGDVLSCRYQASAIECSARGVAVASASGAAPAATGVGFASWDPGGSSALAFDNLKITDVPGVIDVKAEVVGPATVLSGGAVQWRVTVTNVGTLARPEVSLVPTVPAGVGGVVVTPAQGSCGGDPLTCQIGPLAPGQATIVTIAGTAPGTPQDLLLNATATTPQDSQPGNDTASRTTSVVVAPAPPGEVVVDGFDRTGSGLGTTPTGLPWTVGAGSFSTNGSEAVADGPGTSWATVDMPFAFGTLEVTVTETGPGDFWAVFGAVDAANYYRVGPDGQGYYQLQKVVNGLPQPVAIAFQRSLVAAADGDVIRVVRRPDDGILVLVNDQHVIDAGDGQFLPALGFGIAGKSGARFGDLRVRSVMTAGVTASASFSQGDGGLGSLDGGLAYPWWYGWGFGISGGAAAPTNPYYSVAAVDAGSELADVRVTVTTMGDSVAVVFRYGEGGSYYRFGRLASGGGYDVAFTSSSGTTQPPVEVLATPTPADGDVLEVRQHLDGRVEGLVNGVVVLRFVDTTTNIRATAYGLAALGAQARFNNFQVVPE